MYVGLTQAGPEKPGQPCTHTALLHKIEGKEQKKKVAFFKELTASFFLRPKKTRKKFLLQSLFSFVLHVPVYHLLYSKNPHKEPVF